MATGDVDGSEVPLSPHQPELLLRTVTSCLHEDDTRAGCVKPVNNLTLFKSHFSLHTGK